MYAMREHGPSGGHAPPRDQKINPPRTERIERIERIDHRHLIQVGKKGLSLMMTRMRATRCATTCLLQGLPITENKPLTHRMYRT
jgi:hypothetical protein